MPETDHVSLFSPPGAAAKPAPAAFGDALTRRIPRDGFFFRYREIAGTSRAANIREHIRSNRPVVITFTLPIGYLTPTLDRQRVR